MYSFSHIDKNRNVIISRVEVVIGRHYRPLKTKPIKIVCLIKVNSFLFFYFSYYLDFILLLHYCNDIILFLNTLQQK
jgi:hypothetical protein